MKQKLTFLFAIIISFNAYTQEIAKGYVFEDTNKDGLKSTGESGIANVSVSNGVEVVLTNGDGYYELSLNNEGVVFVIKPSDYQYPVDETQIPQFFYIHRPDGSTEEFRYKGFSPTGILPESLNFPLLPIEKTESFRVLVFGDPQPYTEQELDWFDKGVVRDVTNKDEVEFGISVGDIVGDDLSLFPGYRDVMKQLGLPWYNVMGNHDMNYEAKEDLWTSETFKVNFGPSTYSFNHGDAHFIILDDVLYPDPRRGYGYWGGFREDQLDFVENDLKHVSKDKLIVLFMHIPLFEENGDSFRDEDRERLLQLISGFKNTLSISAHTHYMRQVFFGEEDGYTGANPHHHFNIGTPSGDWYSGRWNDEGIPEAIMRDGSPKGYVYLSIDGANYSTSYKAAGKDPSHQMSIFAPKVMEEGKRNRDRLVVNFYTGISTDEVHYRIGDGEWLPLRNYTDLDPTYLMKYFEWDTTDELMDGRRPSYPVQTDHLWTTNLPTSLQAGTHTIEVRAKDRYGKEHFGTREVKVLKK
ncbi:calcineurin-like phosphoesterase C-terminal domain-containing protein [Peijinzhouia sedimentorum]